MRARAPGKLVLSGAYAVLEGAPALVLAVDRFVVADASLPAALETAEVAAAVRAGVCARAVGFDASALRSDDGQRKLGLGSSAAILVATLLVSPGPRARPALSRGWIEDAIRAHREAQGGGSGVDVVACACGGVVRAALEGGEVRWDRHALPDGVSLSVWSMGAEASTRGMLERVRALRAEAPARHAALLGALGEAARAGADATRARDLLDALAAQAATLRALGDAAGAPIVPAAIRAVTDALAPRVVVLPSGAGGGDVVLAASEGALDPGDEAALRGAGLERVRCGIAPPLEAPVSA